MCNPLPQVNQQLCNLCGFCVEACSCSSLQMGEQGPVFRCAEDPEVPCLEESRCHCLCEEVCPTGAIKCFYEIVLGESQDNPTACVPKKSTDSHPQGA
jgi:formate hydrogenlyase subunit 6/NADH:ubiquinone oxidoreductase subunit I